MSENPEKEFGPFQTIDLASLDSPSAYKLLVNLVVPRPIALVTTQDAQGRVNAAPFSFFMGVCSAPPCLALSIAVRSPRTGLSPNKDTLQNIEDTGEFVVNGVTLEMAEKMNITSADLPFGVNELEKAGLSALSSEAVKPPRVAESPVQIECKLYQKLQVGDGNPGSAVIVVGQILKVHYRGILEEFQGISRLGGAKYGKFPETFEMARPKTV